ncbi:MAG: porin family protein [Bacteroidota bacterium]
MTRLFASILLLASLVTVTGQGKTKFSIHVDPQFAWFSSDENHIQNEGSILRLQYGLQMDRFFEENYAFTLGFGVSKLGGNLYYSDSTSFISKEDSLFFTPGQTVRHTIQYLDFPLGLKLKTEELGYATFFLQIGFNPMINISALATSKDEVYDKESIRESIHIFNLGYHAGIGVEYRLGGSTALIGGIRWTSGLTDISSQDDSNITTKSISIHLGILF